MLFEISHTTEYSYSGEVFLEPHYLRFKPKITPHCILKDFSISIEPEPAGLSEQMDIENNHTIVCWFDGKHHRLKIISHSTLEAKPFNPFNFLVYPPEYLHIPFEYDEHAKQLLQPSLQSEGISRVMTKYNQDILKESGQQSIEYLLKLTQAIQAAFRLETRETGDPHPPALTFDRKTGSCRDLAWMQIQMLRQMGIASRFVSGYFYPDVENPKFELHAWVEAWLPGAGWIGLDPGHGIISNEYHIPVASGAYFKHTMPVTGSVRGSAKSALTHSLSISVDPD